MNKPVKIAIDGPAGAGKSTVAKIVAKRLNIEYLDSGAFYRGITKIILDSNIKIEDYNGINTILKDIILDFADGRIIVNGKDVTDHLRCKDVTLNVSPVSSIIPVRIKVNEFLNIYSKDKSIIMDGRDIGTVVFPDAEYKFYLDAAVDERALRRYKEKNTDMTLDSIKESIIKRDKNDKNKKFGALKIADNAIYIDTTNLTLDEVVNKIIEKIKIK
ncbi:MAG: (d)CMP kinase [Spirochaetes bacterium]|nr:(d)CMP kinase [Spirochaetota bacterium]